ncbi:MAG TPA: Fic family protein [Lentisphaeria bacterium]|nr:Fic family protein [Lentisphaeria bacterium]
MAFDPRIPYNDLPPLPPCSDVETKAVLRKAVSASRAVAELKGLGATLPNQSMLVNSLVVQEAQASSEIENIVTTHDALFKAITAQSSADVATKEVLRYREALWLGYNALRAEPRLTSELFVRLVQVICECDTGIRENPGVFIGNARTREIVYTPPEGAELIRHKLGELEQFIHADTSLEPLVKLALIHYQFEAIHPFSDGNGRTGRIINILFLVQQGLLDLPVLYLSRYIIDNKSGYYRLLREVTTHNAWEPWVLFMLAAVEETALLTRRRILAIRDLLQHTVELARQQLPPRVYSKELIEVLFQQPYTKGQYLVDAGIAERQTAAEYLKELEAIGVLKRQKIGKENLFLNVKLYELLTT